MPASDKFETHIKPINGKVRSRNTRENDALHYPKHNIDLVMEALAKTAVNLIANTCIFSSFMRGEASITAPKGAIHSLVEQTRLSSLEEMS